MDTKSQRILNIYETGVSETEITETLKSKINASAGGSLGSIKPTDAAPTPARNGNYTFSIGGNKPAWLTAEAGITTVKAGDGVAVVFTAPSSYTYTHIKIDRIADIYNVTVELPLTAGNYYTLATALVAIPNNNKKLGLIITFKISSTESESWQFVGNDTANWSTPTNWEEFDLKQTKLYANNRVGKINTIYTTFPDAGVWVSDAYNSTTNWRSKTVNCVAGDIISYTVYSSNNCHIVTFFDAANAILLKVVGSGSGLRVQGDATAPTNTSYAVISTVDWANSNFQLLSSAKTYIDNADLLLNQNIDALEVGINGNCYVYSGWIKKSNGLIQSDSTYSHTDFLPVDGNMDLIAACSSGSTDAPCFFYDKNKKSISYFTVSNGNAIVTIPKASIPTGTKYVRFSKSNAYLPTKITGANSKLILANLIDLNSQNIANTVFSGIKLYGDSSLLSPLNSDVTGTWGTDSFIVSTNKIMRNELKVSAKVKFPKDVHSASGDFPFLKIKNASGALINSCYLRKAVTSTTTNYPPYPRPVYNAGIYHYLVGGTDLSVIPDGWKKDLLLGDDSMTIRFIGDCSLLVNQDIRLSISSTVLNIYHSTAASIASFTLSSYATMEALYNAMIASSALSNFEIKFLSLADKVPTDLIECDVPLVGKYYSVINTTSNPDTNSTPFWDSFPFYFTCKEGSDHIYTIDFLINPKNSNYKSVLLIDGYPLSFLDDGLSGKTNGSTLIIEIGCADSGIIIQEFTISDKAEPTLPLIKTLYFEGIQPGTTNGGNSLYVSQKMAEQTFNNAIKNGFNYCKFNRLVDVLDGFSENNKQLFHITHDDFCEEVLTNQSIKSTYLSKGIYPSFGLFTNFDFNANNAGDKFKQMLNLGFAYFPHAAQQTQSIGSMTYAQLINEVQTAENDLATKLGVFANAWDFHWTTENYNTVRFLKNRGYRIIFGGDSLTGTVSRINRYYVQRLQVNDDNVNYMISTFLVDRFKS